MPTEGRLLNLSIAYQLERMPAALQVQKSAECGQNSAFCEVGSARGKDRH